MSVCTYVGVMYFNVMSRQSKSCYTICISRHVAVIQLVVPRESVCLLPISCYFFLEFLTEQQVLFFSKSHPEFVIPHHDERSQGWTPPPPPLFL